MLFDKIWNKSIARGFLGGALLLSMLLGSCAEKSNENAVPEDFLAVYGQEYLTRADLHKVLPGGMTEEDSARFVKGYVTSWIQTKLIERMASESVDMEEINRMVDDYKRQLILMAYKRAMYEHNADAIPTDTIAAYYEEHKEDFILDRPMVKGTYLKVPDDAKNLAVLKRLYKSDRPNDTDRLEKEVLSSAIHYDYFRDKWVDWEQIETKIPEDFGTSADQWLAKHNTLDKSVGGFTYLLYVTDVLPAGSPMPLEVAKSQIINRLLNINRAAYDAELLNELYQRAITDKRLKLAPELKL